MNNFFRSIINFSITILFVFGILTGCGGSEVMIAPDYNSPSLQVDSLKGENKVTKVIDNRKNETGTNAGIAQVGMFNKKVPYNLDVPVVDFVKKALNNIILDEGADSAFIPVTVVIDTFKVYEGLTPFSEAGFFECNLRFIYPFSDDSVNVTKTAVHPGIGWIGCN